MNEFARYYMDFVGQFWVDFCNFWKVIGKAFADAIWNNPIRYFSIVGSYSNQFDIMGWLMYVIVTLITIAFVVFLCMKLFQWFRKFFRFRKIEVEKDELLAEIAELSNRVKELGDEKEKIISLKVGAISKGVYGEDLVNESDISLKGGTVEASEAQVAVTEGRFTKLLEVDKRYENANTVVQMSEDDMIGLPQLVDRFINYAASQLHLFYARETIARYFAAMATAKIIILEGISGTGKTSLPYAMGKFFKSNANIVSVQPSWRDRAEILGYLNEFTKKFNETDFLRALYEVTYREDVNFIVLDEMNLARIEYYFAEFLSVMEMPDTNEWKIDLVPSSLSTDPKHIVNGKIMVEQNVWFIGTANRDDSTFTITDKVYDRAVSLFLNTKADYIDAPYTENVNMSYDYLKKLFVDAQNENAISLKNMENLTKLDDFIQENFKIAFGNRIMKQIKLFVPAYMGCGFPEVDGLDYMICTKILHKFESLNLAFLKKEIDGLILLMQRLFGKDQFKVSIAYLRDLQKMN